MAQAQKLRQLEITLSDTIYQWLLQESQNRTQNVSVIVQAALEQYAQQVDLTKTHTWELCGAFTIAEPETEYIVDSDDSNTLTTNYAEHVDDILYQNVINLKETVVKKLDMLPKEKLVAVSDFVDFLLERSKLATPLPEEAESKGSLADLLACVGIWEFEPGELDEILQDIEVSRLMELEESNGELLA